MAYTPSAKEKRLSEAVAALKRRQDAPGRCLGYCRDALAPLGLKLPAAADLIAKTGHSTALAAYHNLAANPAKYGWKAVTDTSVHPILLSFFNDCGKEGDLVCGHIALWNRADDILYSSRDFPMSEYWKSRIVGLFVPV